MAASVSTNYRQLQPSEVDAVADQCANAWMDESIPMRQLEIVRPELEAMRKGILCAPFDALVKCLRKLPLGFLASRPRLLDVGASAGYYSEVIRLAGLDVRYTGLDYSEPFKALAEKLYPGKDFECGDARQLPFADGIYDIVLHGAVIMHTAEYLKAIQEAARVASRYVMFHRTPIVIDRATEYWEKEAYGVRCLEIHFNEHDLLDTFEAAGLDLIHSQNIFWNAADGMGHWTYLLEKRNPGRAQWERA